MFSFDSDMPNALSHAIRSYCREVDLKKKQEKYIG